MFQSTVKIFMKTLMNFKCIKTFYTSYKKILLEISLHMHRNFNKRGPVFRKSCELLNFSIWYSWLTQLTKPSLVIWLVNAEVIRALNLDYNSVISFRSSMLEKTIKYQVEDQKLWELPINLWVLIKFNTSHHLNACICRISSCLL